MIAFLFTLITIECKLNVNWIRKVKLNLLVHIVCKIWSPLVLSDRNITDDAIRPLIRTTKLQINKNYKQLKLNINKTQPMITKGDDCSLDSPPSAGPGLRVQPNPCESTPTVLSKLSLHYCNQKNDICETLLSADQRCREEVDDWRGEGESGDCRVRTVLCRSTEGADVGCGTSTRCYVVSSVAIVEKADKLIDT